MYREAIQVTFDKLIIAYILILYFGSVGVLLKAATSRMLKNKTIHKHFS